MVKEGIRKNRQIKLLLLVPWLQIGGADKFNLDLASGLKARGWNIVIACTEPSQNVWHEEFRKVADEIHFLSDSSDKNYISQWIHEILTSEGIDIIFLSNSQLGYWWLPWLKSNFKNIPVVDYLHCEELNWYNGGYPMFSACYSKYLDYTVTTSEQLKRWCIDRGSDAATIDSCYINIDPVLNKKNVQRRIALRQELGLEDDLPVIIYVARLTEQKQPMLLIRALEKLHELTPHFKCLIIGDGPDRKMLEKAIGNAKAKKNLIFLGAQPNESVKAYMDVADIFFLPSLYEGIALSIYEAMAKELAIVAADTGGQKELVVSECGFLVNQAATEAPAEKYAELLYQLIKDPSLRGAMGKSAQKRVENYFPIEKMIDKMETILSSALEQSVKLPEGNDAYLFLLDKMISVSNENKYFKAQANSRLFKLARKIKTVLIKKDSKG